MLLMLLPLHALAVVSHCAILRNLVYFCSDKITYLSTDQLPDLPCHMSKRPRPQSDDEHEAFDEPMPGIADSHGAGISPSANAPSAVGFWQFLSTRRGLDGRKDDILTQVYISEDRSTSPTTTAVRDLIREWFPRGQLSPATALLGLAAISVVRSAGLTAVSLNALALASRPSSFDELLECVISNMRVEITAGRQPTHNAHFPATTVHYRINEVFRKLTLQPDEDIAAVWKHFYSQTKDLISGSGAWCVTGQTAGSQPVRATALLQHFPGGRHVGTGIAEGLLAGASLSELSSMVGAVRGFDDFNSKELLLDAVLAWELSPPDLYQWPALAKGSVPVLRNMKDLSADNDIDRLGQLVQIGTTVAPSLAVQPLFEVTFSLCEYRMYINCSLGRPCRLRWRSALWKANGRLAALACLKAQFLKYQALPLPDEINKAAITQALAEDGYWNVTIMEIIRPVRAGRHNMYGVQPEILLS